MANSQRYHINLVGGSGSAPSKRTKKASKFMKRSKFVPKFSEKQSKAKLPPKGPLPKVPPKKP